MILSIIHPDGGGIGFVTNSSVLPSPSFILTVATTVFMIPGPLYSWSS